MVVSIDQFRYDYLTRFEPWFSEGGFNRFLKSGADFTNTHYRHALTITGPGHATIGSGKAPSEHGIIDNMWFERGPVDEKRWDWYFDESGGYKPSPLTPRDPEQPLWYEQDKEGTPLYCVYDDSVSVTSGSTAGMSPHELVGEGLGDRVKDKYPGARVVGIALKDRAAILMAGRKADAAYWFDPKVPGFVSDSYYRYDPKLFAFNATVPGYVPGSKAWNPSPYIPAGDLHRVTFDPPAAWPLKNQKYGGTFPHPINSMSALTYTPYGSDLTADFALWTINNEALGTHTTPDVLFVSFSSTDYFGHYYGPDSMEAADGVVRIDRSLERLFDALERKFGNRVLIALTADHGVQATPEILKLKDPKADAGRLDLRNPYREGQRISDLAPMRVEIERQLAKRLGLTFSADAPYAHALAYFFEEPCLYVNRARIAELKLDAESVKRALRDVVLKLPGVAGAWTDSEIRAGRAPQSIRLSYLAGRSGDLFITLRPNWIWSWGSNSTTHGQPVENDTHVPLLFWGTDITPGRYDIAASPEDLVKTVGAIVGVDAGGADAHVLPCIETAGATERRADSQVGQRGPTESRPYVEQQLIDLALHELDPEGKIPRGEMRIDPVLLNGDKATVVIWIGKPKPAPPGTLSLDCGTGHTYSFEKKNGKWVLVSRGVMMC